MKAVSRLRGLSMAIGIGGFLLSVSQGFATPLTVPPGGAQANIGGCVLVTSAGMMFSNTPCAVANIFDAGSPDTGSYTGLMGGTIDNFTSTPAPGTLATPITNFITFNTTSGTIDFTLQEIDPGIGTTGGCANNTVGNKCTPAGSAYTLTQVSSNKVQIALSINGIAYLGSSSTGFSPTGILFTIPNLIPGTITGVLADLAPGAGGVQDTYAATVSSLSSPSVPEPATFMMSGAGIGLLLVGLIRRRFTKD